MLHSVAAFCCTRWQHNTVPGGGIDCNQQLRPVATNSAASIAGAVVMPAACYCLRALQQIGSKSNCSNAEKTPCGGRRCPCSVGRRLLASK